MKKKIILCAGILVIGMRVFAQCPSPYSQVTSDLTLSEDCNIVGNLEVTNGAVLTISPSYTLNVVGTLNLTGGGTIDATNAVIEADHFSESWGNGILIGGTYEISGNFSSSENASITGITANVGGNLNMNGHAINHFYTNSIFNVQGNLAVGGGAYEVNNTTLNIGLGYSDDLSQAVTLNGGTTLNFSNGAAMDVTGFVNGGQSAALNIDNSDVYVSGDYDNAGDGDVTITNGGSLSVDGDYDNSGSGTTSVDDGSMSVGGDYDNSGGNTNVSNGGSVDVDGEYDNDGGNTNIDGTSSGTVGSCSGEACPSGVSLPVDLVFFKVILGTSIQLHWQTATEINNDHFNIYRSSDGQDFELLSTIQGNGTTNEIQNYSYEDHPSQKGIYYYQLEQVDYDGTNEFFPIKRVNYTIGQTKLKIYPVPVVAGEPFFVDFPTNNDGEFSARIFDLTGGLSQTLPYIQEGGRVRLDSSSLGLSKGIYILQVTVGAQQFSERISVR